MCLHVKEKKTLVAEKDIICYKVLEKEDNGEFITPFQRTLVSKKALLGEVSFKAHGRVRFTPTYWYTEVSERGYIERMDEGCIHTFAKMNVAKLYAKVNKGRKVFECIIPAGTKYYEGYFDGWSDRVSYASKEIIFKKQID